MATSPVNPRPFLATLIGAHIVVKLKWGMEYRGLLKCADAYMNLQMHDVEEYVDGDKQCVLKELLVRCNNILFVRIMDKESSKGAEAMEEEIVIEKE